MNVLREDKELATELVQCCDYSLFRARTVFLDRSLDVHERLEQAEKWVAEFKRCKRDLDELIKRKQRHDELVRIVETMKERGIDLAIVMRRGNE